MLTRRSMLRALGLDAPAAAVAAAVGAPAVAEAALTTKGAHAATLPLPIRVMTGERLDVSRLRVIDVDMGGVTAGRIRSRDKRTVFDHRSGVIAVTG